MLDKWLKAPVHDILHFIGAMILVVGLPMNKVLMSIGTIWLSANLLLNADFAKYREHIKKSKILLLLALIILVHFSGLIYTQDMSYAIHDINSKLPFFVLPIVLIAYPIQPLFHKDLLNAFLAIVLLTSVFNVTTFNSNQMDDIRYMSQFGSHIRYGVIVLFAAILSFYLMAKEKVVFKKLLLLGLSLWFIFYTLYAQVITSYFNLFILSIIVGFYLITQIQTASIRFGIVGLFLLSIGFSTYVFVDFLKPNLSTIEEKELDTHTSLGNKYEHYPAHRVSENGTPIMIYICEKELNQLWNENSTIDYYGTDKKGQLLRGTLFRYMSSLGLRKDAEGFEKLNPDDIRNIENGIPSKRIANSFILARLEGLRLQIQNYYLGQDPSGHSLLQRFEHWRAAIHIISKDPYLGVGTGDAPLAFVNAYQEMNSPLHPDYYNRSHNQFLAFWVSFGVIGFILLILLNLAIIKTGYLEKNWLLVLFGILLFLSFLPEDTLETQQGATFVGFFLGFLHQKTKGV